MNRYRIYGDATVNFGISIEADTVEEALEKLRKLTAEELLVRGNVFITDLDNLSADEAQ